MDNTGKLGLFRIVSESSVAAGVRRIEAVTGLNVIDLIDNYISAITETAQNLKTGNIADISNRAKAVMSELSDANKTIEKLEAKLASGKIDDILKKATIVSGVKVISAVVENSNADEIRKMCESVKANDDNVLIVLAAVADDKITFCAACGANAIKKGANAGMVVRETAKIAGGNGGGKPDLAMAGGKDATKVSEALENVKSLAAQLIKE